MQSSSGGGGGGGGDVSLRGLKKPVVIQGAKTLLLAPVPVVAGARIFAESTRLDAFDPCGETPSNLCAYSPGKS
jgi:hypothetical protein